MRFRVRKGQWGTSEHALTVCSSFGDLLRIKSLRGKGYPKRILVCEKIGSDTFRSKTSLQLRLPVWQCYTESLHQAGVRKN